MTKRLSTLLPIFAVLVSLATVACKESSVIQTEFNPALADVLSLEPDAKCTTQYADVGSDHTYSVRCKLPSKAVIKCAVDAAHPLDLQCKGLGGGDQKAPAAPATPAPAAPPTSTPAPAATGSGSGSAITGNFTNSAAPTVTTTEAKTK